MNAMLPMPSSDDAPRLGAGSTHSEVEMARAMVERLRDAGHGSSAEMLQELRRAFPHSPLAVRVRALAALRAR